MSIDWSKKITADDKRREKERLLRAQRDAAISDTDWVVLRHRDEIDSGRTPTLSHAEYVSLLAHRQELRDWPTKDGWVDTPMPAR